MQQRYAPFVTFGIIGVWRTESCSNPVANQRRHKRRSVQHHEARSNSRLVNLRVARNARWSLDERVRLKRLSSLRRSRLASTHSDVSHQTTSRPWRRVRRRVGAKMLTVDQRSSSWTATDDGWVHDDDENWRRRSFSSSGSSMVRR